MYFHSRRRIANSSVCYNRINATVRAYVDCILEKLDLRLPIRNIAVEEVQVWIPCLVSHFTNKLVSSLNIDITNHDGRTIRGPSSKEAFTDSRGTPFLQVRIMLSGGAGEARVSVLGLPIGLNKGILDWGSTNP